MIPFSQPAPYAARDADQRETALDTRRSVIVEAPAGSGKTALLIQRFLKLLSDESVADPAQVLAITFTRKSTHEMRDRVLKQLRAAATNEPLSSDDMLGRATRPLAEAVLARDRTLGWKLLERPDQLNVLTIDAFCIRIANALPVLAGAGGQVPIENAANLYAAAARQTLNHLGGENPALTEAIRTLLIHRDGNLAECEKLIVAMLGWRDQWANLVPLSPSELTDAFLEANTLPRLERVLENAVCRALTTLDRAMPPALREELSLLAREMSFSDGYKGAENPLTICRILPTDPGTAASSLEHWKLLARLLLTNGGTWRNSMGKNHLKFVVQDGHERQLRAIIARLSERPGVGEALCCLTQLPPLKYPPDQWLVAKALFRVLSHALVQLQLVFESRGECDFTQFSLVARNALSSSSASDDLAASTGSNLQHLLVDEMQDTSTPQYELLRLLTQHWDGYSQTVFLVGDPRQSIYLFRQARVERFIDTLQHQRLGDLPLTAVFLRTNFRSQGGLVDAFNLTFSLLFPSSATSVSSGPLPYREAIPARLRASSPNLVWHTSIVPSGAEDPPAARRLQLQQNAAEIRRLVEDWRVRPLPPDRSEPWKVAVLVRNRRHLLEIVQALKQHPSIPFRAVRIEPLAERQEILDLLALTRALLHPADRTAWLALLRTPWCGLTLRDLHLLAGHDDEIFRKRTILDLAAERSLLLPEVLLSADGLARLRPFWTILSAALAQLGRLPLSRLVERTWRAFHVDAFCDPEEHANATRFFELLDEIEARPGPTSISALQAGMEGLYAAETTAPGAIDLMTIHQAKGLEWDFVVVPQLESSSGRTARRLLEWAEIEAGSEDDDSVAHGIIAPVSRKGKSSAALAAWIRDIENDRDAAERKRLFYVACTRAREELHLFASPKLKANGDVDLNADSLLKAAWPAAEPHFAQAPVLPAQTFQIAAATLTLVPPAVTLESTIQRIPLDLLPSSSPQFLDPPPWNPSAFTRSQGSFEARALGNATHDFLELLAGRIASGSSPEQLRAELPNWLARITTALRAGGMSQDHAVHLAPTVLRSLTRTLDDPDGLWLLAAHPQAFSERSITTPEATIRLDRTFIAGATPRTPGLTHLWIVDFKTGTHGTGGLQAFLAGEREKYAPQLESYARQLASDAHPIRLALYYPALAELLWWPF